MKKKGIEFFDLFKDHDEIFKNDKYHFYVTVLKTFKWKPLLVTNFSDSIDFGDGVVSTG